MPKFDLSFASPLMNAAGSLGFAPDRRSMENLPALGAFFTNPVSLAARSPARGERYLPYPGGFLLHTGYPNPGLRAVIRRYAAHWRRQELPVWVHLLAQSPDDAGQMVRLLEGLDGVAGVELGIPPDINPGAAAAFTRAAQGELPVLARLPAEQALELAEVVLSSGAAAVSLAPLRGALPLPGGGLLRGRLYGPALLPQALEAVRVLAGLGFPVVGAGGINYPEDVDAMRSAAAFAVQLDTVLWRGF